MCGRKIRARDSFADAFPFGLAVERTGHGRGSDSIAGHDRSRHHCLLSTTRPGATVVKSDLLEILSAMLVQLNYSELYQWSGRLRKRSQIAARLMHPVQQG